MVELVLDPVKEVIHARQLLHGGGKGAPPLNAKQQREGAAMNRAAMVSLAASLEAYIETVFLSCISARFSSFTEEQTESVSKLLSIPHTTSPHRIRNSFMVLGVLDVFDGLKWRNCNNETVVEKLNKINQIRNRCAHGNAITYNGVSVSLTLPMVQSFVNYAVQFGNRFHKHALAHFDD